ncbi:MEDS domain-containing protein [Falsibacillus albus]|uniref:MEDS domain-containing protein n=1 Tax=Falsibacillus albus TaxID=2478915 RepID=A0A3L7JQR4_9BACI|nr:MEDS domain-containing protein [Falsibacillus albus]RLQ92409.1 hypothetical protein D9X91_19365 [Falsibacillus albus]
MKNNMTKLFNEHRSVHVLYAYQDIDDYIKQVVNFIYEGIRAGDYVIVIENDHVYPMIEKELSKRILRKQMAYVHRINNFDFYYSSGSYHPPAIYEYFKKTVQPYIENKISFRSWAHVEWATMDGPLNIIEDFEKIVDNAVNELSFPLICAYQKEQMPESLKKTLLETHPYILIEDDIATSKDYKPINR